METIFSKSNANVKFVRSLNEKKFRTKNNAFYLEGIKVVTEILEKAIDVKFIAYSKSILEPLNGGSALIQKIEKLESEEKIKALEFSAQVFAYMVDTVTTQGVLAVLDIPKYNLKEELEKINKKQKSGSTVLILDKVQDMGNLGTIIRTSSAFETDLIICTEGTADIYSPKATRSTMGTILNTKVIYIKDIEDINIIKDNGYKIVTTSLDAKEDTISLDKNEKYAFVMGNEANGVSDDIKNISDKKIKIPMSKNVESLNVSVATAIVLYEQYKKHLE